MKYGIFRQNLRNIGSVATLGPLLCLSSATAGDMPRGIRLHIDRTIGCSNGSDARQLIPQRTLHFQIYMTRKGEIFDFDSNTTDRGVRYIPDGRPHAISKLSRIGGRPLESRGTASAEWRSGILDLRENHTLRSAGIVNEVNDRSTYSIDLNAKACATRSVNFSRRYIDSDVLMVDVNCSRLISQTCRLEIRP